MWTGRPIAEEIRIRLELSLQLAIMATLVAILIALPCGTLAALKQDTWVDYLVRIFSIGGLAVPSFWLGIVIILMFLIFFKWLPPLTFTSFWTDPLANMSQMIWPALAVGYRYSAMATRMTRSAVLEVLGEDYVRTARAKGLRENAVVLKHALRNALLPIVTIIGLEFAFLIGGLVVTEQVFNLNGIGMLLVESITHRDYTMTQALVLLVSFAFIGMNFFLDLLYVWLDPRIQY
jgi:peptide/nickel transport system permease protein